MATPHSNLNDKYIPRLIIWDITSRDLSSSEDVGQELTTHECSLILGNIANLCKPIIVFSGAKVLSRPDIRTLIMEGQSLGLKIILEVDASELSADILKSFQTFGPRIFRIMVGDAIKEGYDTRYKNTRDFKALEEIVKRMKNKGYEIHFGVKVQSPNLRELSYDVDYAVRQSAKGVYCHLCFEKSNGKGHKIDFETEELDAYITSIASIKRYLPEKMYFSPQCIKYGMCRPDVTLDNGDQQPWIRRTEWGHWCLGGKTFAYITVRGGVQVCMGLPFNSGDLRKDGYNFQKIWEQSDTFHYLRETERSCEETREKLANFQMDLKGKN